MHLLLQRCLPNPEADLTCAGATLGFLALLGVIALIVRLTRKRRRSPAPPSPVYISHSETVRNPALRHLGRVSPLLLTLLPQLQSAPVGLVLSRHLRMAPEPCVWRRPHISR